MVSRHRIGMILLSIYLIMAGLVTLFDLHFTYSAMIQAALALVAGILLLLDR